MVNIAPINTRVNTRPNNNVNFGSKYNFTILGKNNTHKPLLFNEVTDFVKENKGITTVFHTGNNKITMGVDTFKMAETVSKGLKKLGIIESSMLK